MNSDTPQPGFGWTVRIAAILTIFCAMVAIVYFADRLLARKLSVAAAADQTTDLHYTSRAIRLKELQPNYSGTVSPDPQYLVGTDGGPAPKQYRIETDGDGFVKPSKIHEEPDYSIFFVGGSSVECLYVDERLRFPYLAGRLLEKRLNLRINSYNAGVSGNGSLHSINIVLNKIVPYRPRYVVLMHNINDLITLVYYGSYWNASESRGNLMVFKSVAPPTTASLLRQTFASALPGISRSIESLAQARKPPVDDEHASVRQRKTVPDPRQVLTQFRANLSAFVSLARAYGIEPVLMTQFNRLENMDPFVMVQLEKNVPIAKETFVGIYRNLNEEIRNVARVSKVQLIDLARTIPGSREYLYDAVHLNEAGSQMVARQIAEALN